MPVLPRNGVGTIVAGTSGIDYTDTNDPDLFNYNRTYAGARALFAAELERGYAPNHLDALRLRDCLKNVFRYAVGEELHLAIIG